MVGIFADFEINTDWIALVIQIKSNLAPIKGNGAVSDAFVTHYFG